MRQRQDKRRLRGREDKALLEQTGKLLDRYLDLQLVLAKRFTEIQAKQAYAPENASSLGDWVARSGCDARDAWRLQRIGIALEHHPGLEEQVRGKEVPLSNAEGLGRAVQADRRAGKRAEAEKQKAAATAKQAEGRADGQAATSGKTNGKAGPAKAVVTPDTDLLKQAETKPAEAFRRVVDAEVESRSTGTARRERVQVHTSKDGLAMFGRACELAKRAVGNGLTPGQAFDEINREYVSRHESDTPGLGTRKRKLGKTSDDPKNRKVPAAVKAAIFKRAGGDCCEVPGCTNRVFLQWAHGAQSNASGGGQEVWNTLRLCSEHHTQFDKLVLTLYGWTKGGRPVFAHKAGLVFMPGEHGRRRRVSPRSKPSRLHPDDPRRRKRDGGRGAKARGRRRERGSDPPAR